MATANLQERDTEPKPYYHPDESDRAARAKRWIEQALGQTANLPPEPKR